MKPESILAIKEINEHFRSQVGADQHEEMIDPAIQFLDLLPSVGTPKLCQRFQHNSILNERQIKILSDWNTVRADQRKHLPSPSSHGKLKQPLEEESLNQDSSKKNTL